MRHRKERKKDEAKGDAGKARKSRKRSLSKPTPGNIQEEEFLDFFYQPRTLTGLAILVIGIVYVIFFRWDDWIAQNNTKAGLLLSSAAFLMYCLLQLRDGHLLRPHPAVWRVVHGTGLLYFMLLVYLLCQTTEGIHGFLQLFDPRIGTPQEEVTYGDDCRIYAWDRDDPWAAVKDKVFDRFTIAHLLGWTVKALILRDWGFMWVASFMFEVLEVTLQHLFANFNECWWDHMLLDVFGANLFGMIIGMKLVRWMDGLEYNWTGQHVDDISSYFGKMKRVALQFTPYSWETYRWQVFSSWRRFMVGTIILCILLLGELNAFFLKTVFQIPLDSDVNLYRLTFWVFLTYMAVSEYYIYADNRVSRVGVNAWLATSLVCFETLLVIKHAILQQMFSFQQLPPANYIIYGWTVTGLLAVLIAIVKSTRKVLVWVAGGEEIYDLPAPDSLTENEDITTEPVREEHRENPISSNRSRSRSKDPPLDQEPKQDRRETRVRRSSFTYLDRYLPHTKNYLLVGSFLNRVFQVLTYLLPVPLLLVLTIDCYRTMAYHPPPIPGTTPGW